MNKRTLTILLVILAALAAIWVLNAYSPQSADTQEQAQPSSGLALLDGETQTDEPAVQQEQTAQAEETAEPQATEAAIDEAGSYTTKEDVSLYLYTYGHLPENFITKSEARALGWSGGGLDGYADGKCIGGDRFGNNEGLLPEANGRKYYECDIDTLHADDRGPKRIVFSNDGLIYYSGDHYDSFEQLYGEP
ncbi:MAG TPA: ribonuclease domain-containing protein [Clostridia bacterium]|nr:ribonuclease domain-containing protein [Clostridia bacterium]